MQINDIIKNHIKLNEIFGWGKPKEQPKELSPEEQAEKAADEKKARDERIAAAVAKAKAEWEYDHTPAGILNKQRYQAATEKNQRDQRQAAMDRHNAAVERLSMNLQIGDVRFTPDQLDQMRAELKALQAKQW